MRLWSVLILWVPVVMLGGSATVNVLQAQKIRSMLDDGRGPSLVGKRVIGLPGYSMDGAPTRLELRGGLPTVVYFFSPTCRWCEQNWANVEALAAGAGTTYRLVAVSPARGLASYWRQRRLTVDLLEGVGQSDIDAFGFSGTPHTVLVSSDGQITDEWRGAFTRRIERQIESSFDILLPGLTEAAPAGQPTR